MESDFESKIEVVVSFQLVKKEICWNKKGENKLKSIYKRRFISLFRTQKLVVEKLEKKYL